MTPEHLQQLNHIDVKVDELEDRFDRHLEIYANNGKELADLKTEISELRIQLKMVLPALQDSKEMMEWFRSMKSGYKFLMAILTLLGTAVGVFLSIKAINK